MKKHLSLILIFVSATCLLVAQEALSLEKAIEVGIANNYQVEIAKRNYDIAKNKIQTKKILVPLDYYCCLQHFFSNIFSRFI